MLKSVALATLLGTSVATTAPTTTPGACSPTNFAKGDPTICAAVAGSTSADVCGCIKDIPEADAKNDLDCIFNGVYLYQQWMTCQPTSAPTATTSSPNTAAPTMAPSTGSPIVGTTAPTTTTTEMPTSAPSASPTQIPTTTTTSAPTKLQCDLTALAGAGIVPQADLANCYALATPSAINDASICACIAGVPESESSQLNCDMGGRNLQSEWQRCQPTTSPSIAGTTGSPTRAPATGAPTPVTGHPTTGTPTTDTSKAPTTFLGECVFSEDFKNAMIAQVGTLSAIPACSEVVGLLGQVAMGAEIDPVATAAIDFCPCLHEVSPELKTLLADNLTCKLGDVNLQEKITCPVATNAPTSSPTSAAPTTTDGNSNVNGGNGIFSSQSCLAVVVPLAACFLTL